MNPFVQNAVRTGVLMLVLLVGVEPAATADSLFQLSSNRSSGTLISQKKARFNAGDIITVAIRENIDASTAANTNTKKEPDVEASGTQEGNPFLTVKPADGIQLLSPDRLPNWKIEGKNEHKARGETKRSNSLVTTVSCIVMKTFDNGNLLIEGEKRVTVNREDSLLKVSGLIRAQDVTPANTIESSKIAKANVELRGSGPLWNNQRRGIFTKVLDWFSPF